MADVEENSTIMKQGSMEKCDEVSADDSISKKTNIVETIPSGSDGVNVVADNVNDSSVIKEIITDIDVQNDPDNCRPTLDEQANPMRMEEDDDFMNDDFMDNLDVVDSWVDTPDNVASPSNEVITNNDADSLKSNQTITNQESVEQHVEVTPLDDSISKESANENLDIHDADKNNSEKPSSASPPINDETKNDKNSLDKSVSRTSQDKKPSEKDGKSSEKTNNQEKKSVNKESSERNRDRKVKSPDRTNRKEHDSRRERSPNKSNKTSDGSKRNTDKGGDRNASLVSSTRRDSRTKRSRTKSRERDSRYKSWRHPSKERNPRRSRDTEQRTKRSTDSHSKRERSVDRDKRSTGKEGTKPSTAGTGKSRPSASKKNPLLDRLVPPGTEDDNSTKTDENPELITHSSQADTLVPPGTVEVLLPDVAAAAEKKNINSDRKRRASKADLDKSKLKSSTEQGSAQSEKDKRGTEKRRRTDDIERKKHSLAPKKLRDAERKPDGRERIARDQDRISRELSLERLRESRNRDREERDRLLSRDRYRSRDLRSTSNERRSSHDSRWADRDRYDRRAGELSPVSPGRMSRGSPISFEFSPVSSRSSSRERMKNEYGRNTFRSFSPISSGSDLSRSMVSPNKEREPRSKRRKRLPFLDEMERKLGLKLTGGHNINQQLRASKQFPMPMQQDFNIDVNAPPPGTFPVNYPPQVPYAAPFPQPMNPMYRAPPFVPIRPVGKKPPPMKRAAGPPPVRFPPAATPTPTPPPSMPRNRNLVSCQREPEKNISFKFQRPVNNQQSGGPKAPPPPAISAGGVTRSEMSLSSILEASVKGSLEATKTSDGHHSTEVGGKNPVDEARVQRCQVAIQTLQEDESFSMITVGRFIVKPGSIAAYSPVARFDHPAQESMFKLKSPLLRNRPVSLKFTTPPPPVTMFKDKPAAPPSVTVPTVKASIWPKNSEKKPPEKPIVPIFPDPTEVEDPDDPDVFIVEKIQTVVSISSESDHDMNLSPVSDVSDNEQRDDKLENVSSGEEDFNQCTTCAERNREKKMVDSSTQFRFVNKRNVTVQVDFVNHQLVGTCQFSNKHGRIRNRGQINRSSGFNQSVHSDASSVSSCSGDEATGGSPPRQPFPDDTTRAPSTLTAESFLSSVANQNVVSSNFQPTSSLSPASSTLSQSMYKPFSNTSNKFPGQSPQNNPPINYPNQLHTGTNSSNLDQNTSFHAKLPQSLSSSTNLSTPGHSFKSTGPFQSGNAIKLTTLNSGTMLGVLSKPAPARGILKMTRSDDIHLSSVTSQPLPTIGKDFLASKFPESRPFQGGNVSQTQFRSGNLSQQQQQPYNTPVGSGQQSSFQSQGMPRQPFVGNASNVNQQGGSGNVLRQPFIGSTNNQGKPDLSEHPFQSGGMLRQPYFGDAQNKQGISEQPFSGGRMFNQPFVAGANNQPFAVTANVQGMGGPLFQSLDSSGSQNMNTSFSNRFGGTGNVPTMVPPPTPVPPPSFNQQNFPRPAGGTGINAGPPGINPDNRQQAFFNKTSVGQQSNYYDRDRL